MKWIWVSFLVLVSLPLSGDDARTSFTPQETQRIAVNAYLCGRIDGTKAVFVELGRGTKELDDLYTESGCSVVAELLDTK